MKSHGCFCLLTRLTLTFSISALCVASAFLSGQSGDSKSKAPSDPAAQSYVVGGKSILLPPPPNGMVEVGPEVRKKIESNSPGQRLLAAFVPLQELPLSQPQWGKRLTTLFTAGVLHVSEFRETSPSDFQEFASYIPENFHQIQKDWVAAHKSMFKTRTNAMGEPDSKGKFHKPRSLGVFYSKQDGFAFGMLKWSSENGVATREIEVTLLLRAKSRLLMLSLQSAYDNKKSVRMMRKTTQEWADAILDANRQETDDPR